MRKIRKPPAGAGVALALSALALAGCISSTGGQAVTRLADDRSRPALALFEEVLHAHFAGQGSGAGPTTTCVSLAPRALTAGQEEALMARFVRLAPASRCRTSPGGPVDSITGTRAEVVQVYEFACTDAEHCAAWVTRAGRPATRYAMRWDADAWRFTSDARLTAE